MTIVLSAVYTTGWVGIGFSKDGLMVGSSAMVGWFNRKGQPKIMQYYLQGTVASKVIPGKGELPLSGVPAAVALHSSRIYVAFQLKLSKPLARQPVILAFGTAYPKHHRLTHHVDKTAIYVDFVAGSWHSTRSLILPWLCSFHFEYCNTNFSFGVFHLIAFTEGGEGVNILDEAINIYHLT